MKRAARVIDIRRTNLERRLQALRASKADCENLIHCLERDCRQSEAEIDRTYVARQKRMSARELLELAGESQRLQGEIKCQRKKLAQLAKSLAEIRHLCQQNARDFQALQYKSDFLDGHQKSDKRRRRKHQESIE